MQHSIEFVETGDLEQAIPDADAPLQDANYLGVSARLTRSH